MYLKKKPPKQNKRKKTINKNKQLTVLSLQIKQKKKKQTNICILKLVHKSDLTITALG